MMGAWSAASFTRSDSLELETLGAGTETERTQSPHGCHSLVRTVHSLIPSSHSPRMPSRHGKPMGRSMSLATNRQKKILRFFGIEFSPNISVGAAGWDIGLLLSNDECAERWGRYLLLTRDFGGETDQLQLYDQDALDSLDVPADWDWRAEVRAAAQEHKDAVVAEVLNEHDGSPFDQPQPEVSFAGASFVFTGKFDYGSRKECQQAVIQRGATAAKSVTRSVDYLVIGTQGSPTWKNKGKYGRKIEAAIVSRRENGSPSIISEDHWRSLL